MSMEDITEGIYANTDWEGGNVSCINTSEGVVLVDTPMMPSQIDDCSAFVQRLNPKGVKYIINTHIHFDHIIGNNRLGGALIMHEQMRERLHDEDSTLRESFVPNSPGRTREEIDFILNEPLLKSEITVITDLALHLGDTTIKAFHMGGHTPDSMVVYVEESKVLITGDNVTSGTHPYKGDACFSDWIKVFQRLKTLDIDIVIPGHGTICGPETIDTQADYFQRMWDLAWDLCAKDKSEDDVVKSVGEALFGFYEVDPEMVDGARAMFDVGTRRLYKELSQA